MSLETDGFWKSGFWATTFWADGFWREGAAVPPVSRAGSYAGIYKPRVINDARDMREIKELLGAAFDYWNKQ